MYGPNDFHIKKLLDRVSEELSELKKAFRIGDKDEYEFKKYVCEHDESKEKGAETTTPGATE